MKLIAHRGIQTNNTRENSLASFQKAIDNDNFCGFELDIRTSLDNTFVVHHDILIDGKPVGLLTKDELQDSYDLPLLEEVLNLETDKIILIEIKEPYIDIKSLSNLIQKYQTKNIYVMSFDNHVIQKLIKENTHAKCGVLNYVLNSEKDYSEYDFIGLLSPLVTEEMVEFFQNRNIEVLLYGIINQEELKPFPDVYYIVDEK